MFATKIYQCFLLCSLFTLSACATPAHHISARFSPVDIDTVKVLVYSPDSYELDGIFIDGAGLGNHIKVLKENSNVKKLLIEPKAGADLFDQAVALHIGEINGLKTYRENLLSTEEISSAQLLEEIYNPIYLDVFDF